MSRRVWRKGPPPHIGWWNASYYKKSEIWRWWNGSFWSLGVAKNCRIDLIEPRWHMREPDQRDIFWNDYWPKKARVPRVKP